MDAKIIQFPSGRTIDTTPPVDANLDDFDHWCEANVIGLLDEVGVLNQRWNEGDIDAFWEQAHALRALLTAWPIP